MASSEHKPHSGHLFDPGPGEQKALVEQIVELCESVLESGEFDSYEEGLKRIRRLCLRSSRPAPTSCGRDVCPPTNDCRMCR